MTKDNELFLCSMCEELTPLIMRKERLYGGVQHNYAECQSCKGKVTHSYTNKHIRSLLTKQQKNSAGPKKDKLAHKILTEMEQLKSRYE
ncbi:hypothetical protein [Candidatus Enterococcus ferrettii]|uniref:Uncharacterized protein n=1 Tax=Candidatus Enterococcus ferrettii TaxID=2815324 RepID=A0ABV0EI03_9ENTE|nr:hypothetical protein [Enterococcus sp. 665A]MBO1341885.1 hypothetical protein [Enterococcus sp. 665A]